MSWKDASVTSKVLIVFTVVFFVSLGLCGISMATKFENLPSAVLGLLGMIVSVIGIVITLIVALIHRVVTGRGGRPQTLFKNRDDKE
ncbi:MAG TPA: hypothetical protein VKB38_12505 [Terracidiphilus sp.]|nr:hypothetical protein [Terracidiphilus sp.]